MWNRKEGRGHKDFKKGGQAGSRGGWPVKKKGTGAPLSYELWLTNVTFSGTLWRDEWNIPVKVYPNQPIFYGTYVLPLSHQHQPTMIKTTYLAVDEQWEERTWHIIVGTIRYT